MTDESLCLQLIDDLKTIERDSRAWLASFFEDARKIVADAPDDTLPALVDDDVDQLIRFYRGRTDDLSGARFEVPREAAAADPSNAEFVAEYRRQLLARFTTQLVAELRADGESLAALTDGGHPPAQLRRELDRALTARIASPL
jgi:glutamyl-tRNA reductase